MRRALLTLAALLLCASIAHAAGGVLFARVDVAQVDRVTLVRGMGEDERDWGGAQATHAAAAFKQIPFIDNILRDHIQPYTWDWNTNTARHDVTPLAWMAVVRMTDEKGQRHYDALSCYDVRSRGIEEYECYYNYGSLDQYMRWHYNTIVIDRAELDAALSSVIEETNAMEAIWNDNEFWVWAARILAGLVLAGVTAYVLPRFGLALRAGWLTVRGHRDELIKAVDQPTDPILVAIGRGVEVLWPDFENNASAFLPVFLRALADGLDKLVDAPQQEDKPAGAIRP